MQTDFCDSVYLVFVQMIMKDHSPLKDSFQEILD